MTLYLKEQVASHGHSQVTNKHWVHQSINQSF